MSAVKRECIDTTCWERKYYILGKRRWGMRIAPYCILFILAVATVSAEDALLLSFKAKDALPVALSEAQRVSSAIPEGKSQYHYVLLDENQAVLAEGPFAIADTLVYDTFQKNQLTGGIIQQTTFEIPMITPFFQNIQTIQLWNDDKLLYEEAISKHPAYRTAITAPQGAALTTNCTTIQNNGDPTQKLDVTFIGHNYQPSERQQFVNDVLESKNFLLSTVPFSANAERINVHYVDQSFDLGCATGCGAPQAICCNETRVWAAASQCPWTWGVDKIVVLANGLPYGGSSSLGGNQAVASNAVYMKEVVAHEFGHAFGVLGDEYDFGRTGAYSIDVPNCDSSSSCPKWSHIPGTQCVQVCGYSNLFRSIQASLMSVVPHNQYGLVSELNMTWRLARFNANPRITSTPTPTARSGQSYTYQVTAADPNNDPLRYILTRSPRTMTINQYSGLSTWNPVISESRAPLVEITVNDGRGGTAVQSYVIQLLS